MPAAPAPDVCIPVRIFLRVRPAECVADASLSAERGLILAGRDTTGLLSGDVSAQWLGAAAIQFLKDHQEELRPGRSLDLEVYHVKPVNSMHYAQVKTCQLAPLPPSWIKHAEKVNPPTTESHPT